MWSLIGAAATILEPWGQSQGRAVEAVLPGTVLLLDLWLCEWKKNPIIEAVFLDIMLLAIANIHSKNIHAYQVLEYGLESMF